MALPDVSISVEDNALGLASPNASHVPLFIGVSSKGTAGVVYAFADIKSLHDSLGEGPLVEAAALAIAVSGGEVLCVPANQSTAGACGSVNHSGSGSAAMSASGAAPDEYDVIVKIVTAGANLAAATAQFQYSLDGGETYSAVIAVPVSGVYQVPAGGPQVGAVSASGVGPFAVAAGQTLKIAIDGGADQTFTVAGAQGYKQGAGGSFAALNGTTLKLKVDGGAEQTVTFTAGATDAATTAAEINTQIVGARATVATGHIKITSDRYGSSSSINITSANAAADFASTGAGTAGSGSASNLAAMTAAELVTFLAALTGSVATASGGVVSISSSGNVTPSVQVKNTSTATGFGFDNVSHTGTSGAITFTWADGSFVVDDTYSFACTAPLFNGTDLADAFDGFLAGTDEAFIVHVVGAAASVGAAAAQAAALDVLLSEASADKRFMRGLIEVPEDTDANIKAAFANVASTRVGAAAGRARTISPINGRQMSRSIAWDASARAAKARPSEDLGRVKSGSLPGVTSITRDERVTPGLDAARFTTARTIIKRQGFYLTNARLLAPAGSDFQYLHLGRVMDIAEGAANDSLLDLLNDTVRVDSNGLIVEQDALSIEAKVRRAIRDALSGDISDVDVVVSRDNNILSTQELIVTIRVRPLGYMKFITARIGFSNPALQLQAA